MVAVMLTAGSTRSKRLKVKGVTPIEYSVMPGLVRNRGVLSTLIDFN